MPDTSMQPALPSGPSSKALFPDDVARYNTVIVKVADHVSLNTGRLGFDQRETVFDRIAPPSTDPVSHPSQVELGLDNASKMSKITEKFPGIYTPPQTFTANTKAPPSPNKLVPVDRAQEWKYTRSFKDWVLPSRRADVDPRGVDRDQTVVLTIMDPIHVGQLWDVYTGEVSRLSDGDEGTERPCLSVCLKLMQPDYFSEEPGYDSNGVFDPLYRTNHVHTRKSAKESAIHEDWTYRSRLRALWGKTVPYYYGMIRITTSRTFSVNADKDNVADCYTYGMILENVGEHPRNPHTPWLMPMTDRRDILYAYKALHQAKVIHHSLGFRHALRRNLSSTDPSTRFALVDFQRADGLPERATKKVRKVVTKMLREEAHSIPRQLGCEIDFDKKQLVSL
ncbi:hypothetical protein IAT40_002739 [Kwoniella sp. CBS 6097]